MQVILSDLVSPRERGRYAGYLGAVFGVGTVAGPLIGGVVTDCLGWRWCFYVGVPFAIAAFVVLQRTLHLPRRRREAKIDYLGATLIAGGVSSLLIWVSLAGQQYDWVSWQTAALVALGIVLCAAAVVVERRAPEPLIPLRLFSDRTRRARGDRQRRRRHRDVRHHRLPQPVHADRARQVADRVRPADDPDGRRALPRLDDHRPARVRRPAATSASCCSARVLLTAGLGLMGTLDETTSLVELGVFMLLLGAGVGMLMQNLVLVVQNTVRFEDIGAGSSLVAFFRSLGGAIGVSVLGALLADHASDDDRLRPRRAGHRRPPAAPTQVPDVARCPRRSRT